MVNAAVYMQKMRVFKAQAQAFAARKQELQYALGVPAPPLYPVDGHKWLGFPVSLGGSISLTSFVDVSSMCKAAILASLSDKEEQELDALNTIGSTLGQRLRVWAEGLDFSRLAYRGLWTPIKFRDMGVYVPLKLMVDQEEMAVSAWLHRAGMANVSIDGLGRWPHEIMPTPPMKDFLAPEYVELLPAHSLELLETWQ